ncbi:MAG: hypothetical protein ACQ9ET_05840, partial [Nitrosomonadaceae bacterium]
NILPWIDRVIVVMASGITNTTITRSKEGKGYRYVPTQHYTAFIINTVFRESGSSHCVGLLFPNRNIIVIIVDNI